MTKEDNLAYASSSAHQTQQSPGPIIFLGGGEWQEGCEEIDGQIVNHASEILVIPTAAAFSRPEALRAKAEEWFARLGGSVKVLDCYSRADAQQAALAETVMGARAIYFVGGSPLHLRAVMKDSLVWKAVLAAWRDGAVLASSSAAASVIGDPMVDPRGGAFTLGLGVCRPLAVIAHFNKWSRDKAQRTITLAGPGVVVAGLEEQSALLRSPEGDWRILGLGKVELWRDHQQVEVETLAQLIQL